jgi:hypothetical protein
MESNGRTPEIPDGSIDVYRWFHGTLVVSAAGSGTRKGDAMLEKDVHLDIHLSEDDTETIAYAVLNLRGDHFESVGKARRNPMDPPMPVIGEELAIARALQSLTVEVMEAAQSKVELFLVN